MNYLASFDMFLFYGNFNSGNCLTLDCYNPIDNYFKSFSKGALPTNS